MVNLSNYTKANFNEFDINLVQKEVDGGEISKEQIDSIGSHPDAKSIVISGLKQDTFDYFVSNYARQFEAISFWKNKSVSDLSSLASLTDVKYINYFFNQKATSLWNMSRNEGLIGLGIHDFSKLHNIEDIVSSPNLQHFAIGDEVWTKMELDSLKPISETNITHFEWSGKTVKDGNFKCLSNGRISTLDINPTQFTVEELTDLLAAFPETLQGTITKPYVTGGVEDSTGHTSYFFLCKGKKTCVVGKDDERFNRYLEDFELLLKEKRKQLFRGDNKK